MADGKRHAATYRQGLLLSCIVSLILALLIEPSAIVGPLGALGGMIMDPDLADMHDKTTYAEQRMWRISPIVGFLFQVYWYPLALLIPHRSWLSHLPPFSTALRMIYAFFPLVALVLVYGYGYTFDPFVWLVWMVRNRGSLHWLFWIFVWWAYQDVSHLKLDRFLIRI